MVRRSGGGHTKRAAGSGTTTRDLLEEAWVEITPSGPRAHREFLVEGVGGSESGRLWLALSSARLPRFTSLHPAIPNLPVSNIRGTIVPDCTSKVRVAVDYGFPSESGTDFPGEPSLDPTDVQIEVSSTVQSTTTQFAIDGTQIKLQHTFVRVDPETETSSEEIVKQGGEVEFQQPMLIVVYRRREPGSPGDKARIHVGTVNSVDVFGDGPRFWMCTRIDGVSDDGGLSYNVTYEFQRHPDTWDATVIFVDPDTGKPVTNPTEGVWPTDIVSLLREIPIYSATNFFDLNLTV